MIITPSNNCSLIGYNKEFLDFKKLYDNDNLPNKIIFSGINGIGKSTFVYHLANYIFSKDEVDKYNLVENIISDKNRSYNLVSKNLHPNFFLISNTDDKQSISISKIREMINWTNKSSFNDGCKIILIDNIEFLNNNSINALLKIIEEPNHKVFFFLIHNNKIKILDTIKSRCIKFNFFLENKDKIKIINSLCGENFYSNLNSDFKNIYNSPGDIFNIQNVFKSNNINEDISVDNFLKLIIEKKIYKKDFFVKYNFSLFLELYFNKLMNNYKYKNKLYFLYKYFLLKINDCNKYNLDLENILIEFNGSVLSE